jgi:hypothetical protein
VHLGDGWVPHRKDSNQPDGILDAADSALRESLLRVHLDLWQLGVLTFTYHEQARRRRLKGDFNIMVTTLGDLKSYSKSRAGTMYSARPRKRLVTRPDDTNSHLPHEVVGILVAQALDWDTQRIVEAFAIALKQASEQSYAAEVERRGGAADLTPESSGIIAETASAPSQDQRAPDKAQSASRPSSDALNLLDAKGGVSDQVAQPTEERRAQSIADVRQQFITLGELVLDAIEAVDRGGNEAIG